MRLGTIISPPVWAGVLAATFGLCLGCGDSLRAPDSSGAREQGVDVSSDPPSTRATSAHASAPRASGPQQAGTDTGQPPSQQAQRDARSSSPSADAADAADAAIASDEEAMQEATEAAASDADGGAEVAREGCLQGGPDFTSQGPYPTAEREVALGTWGTFTIFYPEPFDSACAHPFVAWSNGTGVTGADQYRFYHEHAASWGIVTIASHDSNASTGDHHMAAIDYLLAQNEEPDSPLFEKLSGRAGTAGHAQGAYGASRAALHPNVEAEVEVSGNGWAPPAHIAFLCLTGTLALSATSCARVVAEVSAPALDASWDGGDRVLTPTLAGFTQGDPGNAQYIRLNTAWFRCFLADDETACQLFKGGDDCSVCNEPGWARIEMHNY